MIALCLEKILVHHVVDSRDLGLLLLLLLLHLLLLLLRSLEVWRLLEGLERWVLLLLWLTSISVVLS